MSALFHRRFFPGDVAATVAYATPLLFALGDERPGTYMAETGTAEGKDRIHGFQRRLLEFQDSLIWRFAAWFPRNGLTLSLPPGPVFQDQIVSYEWGFWQRHVFEYDDIPSRTAPYDEWIDHLAAVVQFGNVSDEGRAYFRPHIYQVYT